MKNCRLKVISRYLHEIKCTQSRKTSKKHLFMKILQEETTKFKLGADFRFPYSTALSRIRRSSLNADGIYSPLFAIESKIISLIICMSKIKRAMTCSEALRLINELIDGTETQKQLIAWKLKMRIYFTVPQDLGRVGLSWWNNFLKRNCHLLRSKSGKKYAFDRSNFTTYLNFRDMYDHIEDILVFDSKVATKDDTPVWVNEHGQEVSCEDDAYGCKATIHIHRPDMCIVLDEVGSNLSQENDHSMGGQLFMCGSEEQPYQSCATKNNHFTCLGLTRLDGVALMCVVIIQGKKRDVFVESGIDWSKLGDKDDIPDNLIDDDASAFFSTIMAKIVSFQVVHHVFTMV